MVTTARALAVEGGRGLGEEEGELIPPETFKQFREIVGELEGNLETCEKYTVQIQFSCFINTGFEVPWIFRVSDTQCPDEIIKKGEIWKQLREIAVEG